LFIVSDSTTRRLSSAEKRLSVLSPTSPMSVREDADLGEDGVYLFSGFRSLHVKVDTYLLAASYGTGSHHPMP